EEKRSNQTHGSTTDSESVLYRKAKGKEAKLCFGAHLLMENRHGLCAEFTIHNPIETGEAEMALQQLDEHEQMHRRVRPRGVGALCGEQLQSVANGPAGCGSNRIVHLGIRSKILLKHAQPQRSSDYNSLGRVAVNSR